MLPVAQQAHQPGDDDGGDDRAEGAADGAEAVGGGALLLLEPEGHGYDLAREDGRLGEAEDAAAGGEDPHVRGPAGADAGEGPDGDTAEHHALGAELIHEDTRNRVHDRVAEEEHVHDPGVFEVADGEVFEDFRLEDGKQLPVQIVANNRKEHQGHDHPLPGAGIGHGFGHFFKRVFHPGP